MATNSDSEVTSPPPSSTRNNAASARPSDWMSNQYKMNHGDRGHAVIINNREFDDQDERKGTDNDAKRMLNVLTLIGFKKERIKTRVSATVQQMKDALLDASKEDYSDCDCFVCVILSHGADDGEIYGRDGTVRLAELIAPLKGKNCPSLVGKPKLFFIQACQGSDLDLGVEHTLPSQEHDATQGEESDSEDEVEEWRLPSEADFLMAYSTVPGYLAWKTKEGAWFIQAVAEVISNKWMEEDLLSMMTEVNRKVACDFEYNTLKQMPCINSMLTGKVFFHSQIA